MLIEAALAVAAALAGAAGDAAPLPAATPPAVIVDHRCTDLAAVPAAWIEHAKAVLRVGYSHTSHGSQVVTGLAALEQHLGPPFDAAVTGWGLAPGVFLNDLWGNAGGADDLGHGGDLGWRDATVAMLDAPGNDRNVVMWSWCGGVSESTANGIASYLSAMEALERAYPAVRFVYITGHLDGSGPDGNLHQRNQQIRAFCRTTGKVLFDFADIESYDPDGRTGYLALLATDGCEYDADGDGNPWGDRNWAADWVAAHPASALAACAAGCGDCAHSHPLNCVMKARAFWWLMARLAGWSGPSEEPPARTLRLRRHLLRPGG